MSHVEGGFGKAWSRKQLRWGGGARDHLGGHCGWKQGAGLPARGAGNASVHFEGHGDEGLVVGACFGRGWKVPLSILGHMGAEALWGGAGELCPFGGIQGVPVLVGVVGGLELSGGLSCWENLGCH